MRISYYFPPSPRLASYRYRMAIPGKYLESRGHDVRTGDSGSVVIFGKHFDETDVEVANATKSKVVFDWCDDHRGTQWEQHYRRMASLADAVTCPTEMMKDIIKRQTDRDAVVISDPYEFPESEPKLPGNRLFWFGHQSNLHTLKGLRLDGYKLGILTGNDWSLERMQKGFDETDMVIIPTNPEKQYKSPNRMVEALRQGRFVVAGPMPAYEGYKQWIGDIKEGCDWAMEHPVSAMERIREGQAIVREKHSPEVIGAQWEMLLKSL